LARGFRFFSLIFSGFIAKAYVSSFPPRPIYDGTLFFSPPWCSLDNVAIPLSPTIPPSFRDVFPRHGLVFTRPDPFDRDNFTLWTDTGLLPVSCFPLLLFQVLLPQLSVPREQVSIHMQLLVVALVSSPSFAPFSLFFGV